MLKKFGLVFYLIAFSMLTFDSFANPASSLKYFFIDSRFLYTLFILLHILFNFLSLQLLPTKLIKFNNRFIFPLTTITFIAMALANGVIDPNFAFRNFYINVENIKYLFYLSGFVFLANIQASWLKTFPQKLLYLGGILFLIAFNLLSIFQHDLFIFLVKEDGPLEDIQVVFYLTAMFFALFIALRLIQLKKKNLAIYFLILALGLFFISGEEISWGQRIFDIKTPDELSRINYQHELTVHNIGFFQSNIEYIYMLIGLGGAFSRLIAKYFFPSIFKKYYLIFPQAILFFYFFTVSRFYFIDKFVYFTFQLFSFEKIGVGDKQEVSETLLAFGFACFAVLTYRSLRTNLHQNKK